MRKIALLLAVMLLAGTALAADSAQTLKQADRQFCADTRAQGLEGWMKWFASDGYVGNDPAVRGTEKLREFFCPLFARKNLDFRWTPTAATLFASGTLGYTSGDFTMSFTDESGEHVTRTGQYLTVWQKQNDGSWKALADYGAQAPLK